MKENENGSGNRNENRSGSKNAITGGCSFEAVRPIMTALPYPPQRVAAKNQAYADLLSIDYCGSVSELSAIMQYINNENRLSLQNCSLAKSILGIAMAEMIHLQKLGELIVLLGGQIDFMAGARGGKQRMWTPGYLSLPGCAEEMLLADVNSERETIRQYRMHMRMIGDNSVNAVLERIIQDEEYHIVLLQTLAKEL